MLRAISNRKVLCRQIEAVKKRNLRTRRKKKQKNLFSTSIDVRYVVQQIVLTCPSIIDSIDTRRE